MEEASSLPTRCFELRIEAVKLYLDAKKSLTFLLIRGKMAPFTDTLVTQRGLSIYLPNLAASHSETKTNMINFSSRDNFGDVYRPLKMSML